MKKFLVIFIAFISLFIFNNKVNASSINDFVIESDKLEVFNGDSITLTVKMNINTTLSSNSTFYYIDYDKSIFEFVSFTGIDRVKFDKELIKLYLTSDISVESNDTIGTLVLKVKDDAVTTKTTVEIPYYSYYQTKDNEDSIGLVISPVIKDTTTNETVTVEEENNFDYTPYIIGGGVGIISVALLIGIISYLKK